MAAKSKRLPFKRNITAKVVGTRLFLCVDMAKEGAPSKSGKSSVIASTLGVAKVPGYDDCRIGLNVYRKTA